VMDLAPRQVRRQRLALGLVLLALVLLVGPDLVELGLQRRQVGIDRLFQQALLLGVEGLGLGSELQPLEHRHLVVDLVDQRLLEGDLAIATFDLGIAALNLGAVLRDHGLLARHLAHQGAHDLAQLLRVELVELRRIDHGA
jgi:hypothetical protein